MNLIEKIEEACRQGKLLQAGQRVAVGCSGGADSVALVRLLDELKEALGIRLLVCHLNHQLRGKESDGDEVFVKELAGLLELKFVSHSEDVAARADRMKQNLEEAGREARLEFFAALVEEDKADVVALAHTLDDQAETVLQRLVRGTGTTGLAGIYPFVEGGGQDPSRRRHSGSGASATSKLSLVRPLLGVRREELRDYLKGHQQAWREDSSNRDRTRLRNRIRLDLLPELNPAAIEHLGQLAGHVREEESFWAGYIEEVFEAQVRREGEEWHLTVDDLLATPAWVSNLPERQRKEAQRAVARRLLRRVIREARGGLRRITQGHIESVLELAAEGHSGQQLDLPGARAELRYGTLVFSVAGTKQEDQPYYELEVAGPGRIGLPEGRSLEVKLLEVKTAQPGYNKMARKALDAGRVGFPLVVRSWLPGDRYRPRDVHREKKLKEFFQRHRVPRAKRRQSPVVLCGEDIVWTALFGPAAWGGLSKESKMAICIEETATP